MGVGWSNPGYFPVQTKPAEWSRLRLCGSPVICGVAFGGESRMPRYFFHFRDKDEFNDQEGIVLEDLDAARAELATASGEILRGMGEGLRPGCILEAWITDAEGETVCALAVQFKAPPPQKLT
jgi:hypothetical protein